ncbi:MAG TPA: hypothetical protein VHM92_07185 [Allosphingosinicella sp.]|nr:hypothetical protein [Allosphingosinicella sp.]
MTRVDALALDKIFSPVAGWAEHRLGIGQWRLAFECLNGHVAFYLGGLALTVGGKGAEDGIFAHLLTSLGWLLIMDFVRRHAQRQAASSIGGQSARLGEWHFRLILLLSLPLSFAAVKGLANFCYSVSLILLVCHLYFKACDTPPPRGRRQLAYSRS